MQPQPKLFVSAPSDSDLRKLLSSFRELGVDVVTWADVAPAYEDTQETLTRAIREAEIFIAVLSSRNSLSPALEAGMALALGKPLILIVDKGVAVPAALSSALIVRGRPGDVAAIQYALEQILRRPIAKPFKIPPKAVKRETLGQESDTLSTSLGKGRVREDEVLSILSRAIEASGALAVRSPKSDTGFDLGVWSDELGSISANPLLIEFTHAFTPSKRREILARLRANPVGQIALVVYPEDADPPAGAKAGYDRSSFPVLAISIQDLLRQLKTSTFAEVIRRLRNLSVHGS